MKGMAYYFFIWFFLAFSSCSLMDEFFVRHNPHSNIRLKDALTSELICLYQISYNSKLDFSDKTVLYKYLNYCRNVLKVIQTKIHDKCSSEEFPELDSLIFTFDKLLEESESKLCIETILIAREEIKNEVKNIKGYSTDLRNFEIEFQSFQIKAYQFQCE